MQNSSLAFEHSVDTAPQELWRVVSLRVDVVSQERPIRHTNWFGVEQAARDYAASLTKRGHKVLSVTHYVLVPEGKPE
jgi:hypothetical protein